MPVLLFTAALAAGQPSSTTARWVDPAAPARVSVVQDLSAVVSGTAPANASALGARSVSGANTGPISLRLTGAGLLAVSTDTGVNSVTQSATAVSARVALPNLTAFRP